MKEKCWILHPYLKSAKFKANLSHKVVNEQGSCSTKQGEEVSMAAFHGEVVRTDLEALIRSIASLKESGTTFFASKPSKTLVIDSGASHHMISNPSLIENINPAKTPLEEGYKAKRTGEQKKKKKNTPLDPLDEPYEDVAQYQRNVGKLIYLTITRPDLCFVVNQVSQHMNAPTKYHWNMLERILRYIKGSPGQGIWMEKNESTQIVGYGDADYAGDTTDRRSTTEY